jgi:hypothetical protein
MQIGGITNSYPDPMRTAAGEIFEALGGGQSNSGKQSSPTSLASVVAARDILEQYDVTDITPSEYSDMVQELFEAGVIDDGDFNQLAAVRLELDAAGVEPNESIDLVDFYRRKAEDILRRTDGTAEPPDALKQRLDWVEKFSLIHENPTAAGLNALV